MADDICQFVQNCDICQRVNDAKFIKVDTALLLLSHKCGTRYFVSAQMYMSSIILAPIDYHSTLVPIYLSVTQIHKMLPNYFKSASIF